MSKVEAVLDEALDALSHARTALDDPVGLDPEVLEEIENADQSELDQFGSVQGPSNLIRFAIDRIDDAMRLLNPEKDEPKFGLMVSVNGVFVSHRFDPEQEAIDVVGEALRRKELNEDDVVAIVVGLAQ